LAEARDPETGAAPQGIKRRRAAFLRPHYALGKLNLAAIQRIVSAKYQQGAAFNR
jgi:hypothetical protein